ncbi:MAG: hypothetical protein ACT6FB_05135 [Methanosarcinaceae archaeon]
MKSGLLPETTFVRTDFAIETGQLMPKQISIPASKKLIGGLFPFAILQRIQQRIPCCSLE